MAQARGLRIVPNLLKPFIDLPLYLAKLNCVSSLAELIGGLDLLKQTAIALPITIEFYYGHLLRPFCNCPFTILQQIAEGPAPRYSMPGIKLELLNRSDREWKIGLPEFTFKNGGGMLLPRYGELRLDLLLRAGETLELAVPPVDILFIEFVRENVEAISIQDESQNDGRRFQQKHSRRRTIL
jgi:hypothetical protein